MQHILVFSSKGGSGKSTLALALADLLPNSCLVDLTLDRTLTNTATITGRHHPVAEQEARGDYAIYDTPIAVHNGHIHRSDLILIPTLLGYPDLLVAKAITNHLSQQGAAHKARFIYNRIRKPLQRRHQSIKQLFDAVVPCAMQTLLSESKDFQELFARTIQGIAQEQIGALIAELGLA